MTSPAHATDTGDTTTGTALAVSAATSSALGADPDRGDTSDALVEPDAAAAVVDVDVDVDEALPSVGTYRDGDGRVHYASPHSKATKDHLAAGEWTEVDPNEPPFDPTQHLVREVVAYLNEHAHDADEIARVLAAEAEGEDRPSIRNWPPAT